MERALERAATVMAAAFISRGGIAKPEDAATLYFRCLDALKTANSEVHSCTSVNFSQREWQRHVPM